MADGLPRTGFRISASPKVVFVLPGQEDARHRVRRCHRRRGFAQVILVVRSGTLLGQAGEVRLLRRDLARLGVIEHPIECAVRHGGGAAVAVEGRLADAEKEEPLFGLPALRTTSLRAAAPSDHRPCQKCLTSGSNFDAGNSLRKQTYLCEEHKMLSNVGFAPAAYKRDSRKADVVWDCHNKRSARGTQELTRVIALAQYGVYTLCSWKKATQLTLPCCRGS